jgi:MoaD family protein
MTITARVPGSLKAWLDGACEADCQGRTVGECLADLSRLHPRLQGRVLDEERGMPKVLVFLNGDNVMGMGGLDTPVNDGDEIALIPLAAGG